MVGLEVAATKGNNINHFSGFAMDHIIGAGAYGAGAGSGGGFNPAVVIGLVVANIRSSVGFGLVGVLPCRLLMLVGSKGAVAK